MFRCKVFHDQAEARLSARGPKVWQVYRKVAGSALWTARRIYQQSAAPGSAASLSDGTSAPLIFVGRWAGPSVHRRGIHCPCNAIDRAVRFGAYPPVSTLAVDPEVHPAL